MGAPFTLKAQTLSAGALSLPETRSALSRLRRPLPVGGGRRELETENATVASPSSRHRAGGRVARILIDAEFKGQIAAHPRRGMRTWAFRSVWKIESFNVRLRK